MRVRLSDEDIVNLLKEPKPLPENYRGKIKTKLKRGHKEKELDIIGSAGSEFQLVLR